MPAGRVFAKHCRAHLRRPAGRTSNCGGKPGRPRCTRRQLSPPQLCCSSQARARERSRPPQSSASASCTRSWSRRTPVCPPAVARWPPSAWRRASRPPGTPTTSCTCSPHPGIRRKAAWSRFILGATRSSRRFCCWRTSMWSRRSAKTGRAIRSRSWKRTAISTRAGPWTTRPRAQYGSTRWFASANRTTDRCAR